MVEKGKFIIYPNFPHMQSLTTNHLEMGANNKLKQKFQRQKMGARFSLPLLAHSMINSFRWLKINPYLRQSLIKSTENFQWPSLMSLHMLNVYSQPVKKAIDAQHNPGGFDQCIMRLSWSDSTNVTHLTQILNHYSLFKDLNEIQVIISTSYASFIDYAWPSIHKPNLKITYYTVDKLVHARFSSLPK